VNLARELEKLISKFLLLWVWLSVDTVKDYFMTSFANADKRFAILISVEFVIIAFL
jgi:hypothetical protein